MPSRDLPARRWSSAWFRPSARPRISSRLSMSWRRWPGTFTTPRKAATTLIARRPCPDSCLVSPLREASDFLSACDEFEKLAWYMHHAPEGRYYFDRQENLTKLLQSL